jgi:hypothetical protein
MNNERRSNIRRILDEMTAGMEALRELQEEEQESFDNLPEGLQQSDRGQEIEECAGDFDMAIDSIENAIDEVQDIL